MTTIIASHLLPDTAVSCSPSSLILNQNNQFIILTRSILYIYVSAYYYSPVSVLLRILIPSLYHPQTPSLGIQIDAISLQQAEDKSAVAKNKPKTSKPNLLPMFSTTIAIDKKNLVVWADFSDGKVQSILVINRIPKLISKYFNVERSENAHTRATGSLLEKRVLVTIGDSNARRVSSLSPHISQQRSSFEFDPLFTFF